MKYETMFILLTSSWIIGIIFSILLGLELCKGVILFVFLMAFAITLWEHTFGEPDLAKVMKMSSKKRKNNICRFCGFVFNRHDYESFETDNTVYEFWLCPNCGKALMGGEFDKGGN